MLLLGVGRVGNLIARPIGHCELGNLIAPRAIGGIAEPRMIGIELHDVIAASRRFVADRTCVNVI